MVPKQRMHPWRKTTFHFSKATNWHNPFLRDGILCPWFSLHVSNFSPLYLYTSYACYLKWYKFLCVAIIFFIENMAYSYGSSTPATYSLPPISLKMTPMFIEEECDTDVSFMDEQSTFSFSTLWQAWGLCNNIHILQNKDFTISPFKFWLWLWRDSKTSLLLLLLQIHFRICKERKSLLLKMLCTSGHNLEWT